VRDEPQLLPHLLTASGDRLEALVLGQLEEDALDLLVDRGDHERQRLGARLLGREVGIQRVGCERPVKLPGHLAQPAQAREEPIRGGRDLLQRQLPAVPGAWKIRLEDPERGLDQPSRVLVPAGERRDMRKSELGQEAQHLELRIDSGLEPPVGLQDQLVAEDDRRVGLLGRERARVGEIRAVPAEVRSAELDHRLVAVNRRLAAHQVDELTGERRIGERVVHDPLPRRLDDLTRRRVVPRPEPEQELVQLVRPGVEPNLGHGGDEHRRLRSHDDAVHDAGVGDVLRLRAEPSAAAHEVDERALVEELARDHSLGDHRSSRSSNQKKPRGASVSR
jgi:hypothetical protein